MRLGYSFILTDAAWITLTKLVYEKFTLFAYDESWLRVVNVVCAWIMLANNAEPKSNEKWWIFFVNDYLINFINQFIISYSKNTGITVSLTEHFCNNAKQNLCMTEPFFSYSMI